MRDKKSSAQGSRASRWRNPAPSRLFAGVHRQRPHLPNSASRPETKAEAQCIHCIRAVFARRIPRSPYSAKSRRLPSASCVCTRILPKPKQTPNATLPQPTLAPPEARLQTAQAGPGNPPAPLPLFPLRSCRWSRGSRTTTRPGVPFAAHPQGTGRDYALDSSPKRQRRAAATPSRPWMNA